tara:strand:+ start:231 stop:746 length:516 start_codon:yes stop_codon:yes gene_type:complete
MINIIDTDIEDVKILKPNIFKDDRGYFFESFSQKEFCNVFRKIDFIQDNESKSSFGVLRGLHYQEKPYEQSKLVRVVHGKVQDVAVDIRKDSKTYLNYVSVILSADNKNQIFIPKGFAHGFLVLSKEAVVCYKVDNIYKPNHEKVLKYNDDSIGIKWGLEYNQIKLSKKDK